MLIDADVVTKTEYRLKENFTSVGIEPKNERFGRKEAEPTKVLYVISRDSGEAHLFQCLYLNFHGYREEQYG